MSGAALDMTLDDLIKTNRKSSTRGRGRAAGPGPARRLPKRYASPAAPYATPKAPETAWGHDMYSGGGQASSIETGTKLYVSNLDDGVSADDIKELFAEVGDLKRYMIHYDRSGRSEGTAEVVFSRRQDALAAIRKYNNVQLDGKPMKIDLVGTNISAPVAVLSPAGAFGHSNSVLRSGQGRGGYGRSRGGGQGRRFERGHGFGRGRGWGRGHGEKLSAEDLDADLEKYHESAMASN
ncbi:RRM motif-containing protein [Handroanthus impetiginosus]|uniref:RRM motif-containing protein n=1 Tax=Handroanthus impetiginosus TaxID=429701 RepID=A0A2G9I3M8_9LAMI|nr:RRM motif-containing protein [Handroanthus impetiginosus]